MINNSIVIIIIVVVGVSALESSVTYNNTNTIAFQDYGQAQTYPSIIDVPLEVYPKMIKITFIYLSGLHMDEMQAVLVSPSGKKVTLVDIPTVDGLDLWVGTIFFISDYASAPISDSFDENAEYLPNPPITTGLPEGD